MTTRAVAIVAFFLLAFTSISQNSWGGLKETVIYDEAADGDFDAAAYDSEPAFSVGETGAYVVKGTGIDAVDDVDSFVFEVTGEKPFDFCLIADPAEFKKLRAIDKDGNAEEVAFGSTNPRFNAPRNISKMNLPPGRYHVEMYFGPQGAVGDWLAKVAIRADGEPIENLCVEEEAPSTTAKMKQAEWPGAISIYHGHNWGDDKAYIIAIKEAGYQATGVAEWQIDEVAEQGLKSFVFIWPHEAATIPAKHKDNDDVLCYYLSDRIRPSQWGVWANHEKLCHKGDPRHPAFFTMNANWGGIDQFCEIVRGRSMEFYHYHWDGNRQPHLRYAILDQFRKASNANGDVPVCRIVEVRPEDMRKTRHTVYISLAYGLRGYRMGGTIFDGENRDQRNVPARNAFGEEIKSINEAINAYSPVFAKTRCAAVYHTEPLPPGVAATPEDSWVQLDGKELLVGRFELKDADAEEKADYLLVANRDAFNAQEGALRLTGAKTAHRMDKASGEWKEVELGGSDGVAELKLSLEEASGELYRITR